MAALTAPRNTKRLGAFPEVLLGMCAIPLKATAKLFTGALAALDGGLGVAGAVASGLMPVGRVKAPAGVVDNTSGADSALTAEVEQGVFPWDNSASTEALTTADRGKPCFIVDDHTVSKTSNGGTRSVAGIVVDVDASFVYVFSALQIPMWLLYGLTPPPTVAAAGAIPVGAEVVLLNVTGTTAYTLANGKWVGQKITVVVIAAASSPAGTVTPATGVAGANVVSGLGVVGEFATWMWTGTAGWVVISSQGVTVA